MTSLSLRYLVRGRSSKNRLEGFAVRCRKADTDHRREWVELGRRMQSDRWSGRPLDRRRDLPAERL